MDHPVALFPQPHNYGLSGNEVRDGTVIYPKPVRLQQCSS